MRAVYWLCYVNPHTDELVMERSLDDRQTEALRGQGVTQLGIWSDEDVRNWGRATVKKWHFTRVPGRLAQWTFGICGINDRR